MSSPGLDPIQALAQGQMAPLQSMPQGPIDPVMALAQGQAPPPAAPGVAPPGQPKPQQVSTFADMVRAVPGGLAKGVAGMVGLPNDVAHLFNYGMDKLTGANVSDQLNKLQPGSEAINKAVSEPFGGYYKPQTIPGQYTETAASFAPNALFPGTMGQKLARVLVPATASETAGQMTKGSPYEGAARAGAALLGGLGEGAAEGALAARANPAPSLEDLQKLKADTYKAADQAGVVISPKSFQQFATDLGTDLTKNNVVQADIHKNALSALNVIQDEAASGQPISLARADAIRQAVGGAVENAASNSKTDLAMAMKVKRGLDSYLDTIGPGDVLSGDPQTAVPLLKEARSIAQRQFKGEQIQKMIDLAQNSASTNYSAAGYEQALRVQFKNLNAQLIKNPSLASSYSDAEREAIEQVAKGGPIGNALRFIGKFSAHGPVSAGAGMGIGALLGHSVGAGATEGGLVGAIGVPMIGEAGRMGATALTERNARLAAELMRRGTPAASVTPAATRSGLSALLLSRGVSP